MRRVALRLGVLLSALVLACGSNWALAEEGDYNSEATADTLTDAVRVTVLKMGGANAVQSVSGGGSGGPAQGCVWTLLFTPDLADAPWGMVAGPIPDPDARFALLLCNGAIMGPIWVAPSDIVDLDAAARAEAQRYVEDVVTPAVSIGVNPAAKGLAGLRSWFWIDGFTGSVTAPAITAFGLTIDVRMSLDSVTWDFGDGTVEAGDLGRAYPDESTVRHAYRDAGSYVVSAAIGLVPEYRVNGGPWLTLPSLTVTATTSHQVEQRQPVVSNA